MTKAGGSSKQRQQSAASGGSGANDPMSLVNATGFAFQLAVEELVQLSADRHKWSVTSREHGWRDQDDTPRFVDLVLTRGQIHLVVECKRPRDAQWVFLVPDAPKGRRAELRRHFRAAWLRNEETPDGLRAITSLSDFQLEPTSWESSFCAIRGASERDQPMLDRVCAELTSSADAILSQQLSVDGRSDLKNLMLRDARIWIAVPLIVTTAGLRVCRFDPGSVSTHTGEIPRGVARFEQVHEVRYRKSFDVQPHEGATDIGDLERYSQRTVAIVNAAHLAEWLENFDLKRASYG